MTASYLAQARLSKPYLVIWHPLRQLGAWYDRRLQLRASETSPELIAFARADAYKCHPWNDLADIELPLWAQTAALDDCVCFWMYHDGSTSDEMARIPGG
jgi:hypothetical protein